ncbi:calcineurin B-like protein 7 isoform X1 [Sesamum indicum]|uniref:Calcineurin B-like protein n=1 Tax=Sesamum indicum TaxID=4182 RepID=A0A6I9TEM7_SESIN|nr:calcineurin B-like protein 7 isoform X1 [Sesamum indicum]
MGCLCTKERRIFEDPSMLSTQTIFTVKEVKTLNELYRKLGSTLVDDGFLNREEFKLGLFRNSKEKSLFADRMFDMFDSKHDGVIDFGEFVRSMSIFHPDTPQEEKAIFAFRLYDIWQTGFIEKEEVKEMIVEFLNESNLILSDDIIEDIIDKTFEEADSDKDGMIDIEEWKDLAVRRPTLLRNMTIPYLKDMTTFPSFTMRTEREDEINI